MSMFRSLKIYNYRVWFGGSLISNIGTWMQTTAQAWVVLTELTDGDAAALGLMMALQNVPHVLLVGVTGWVADRFDRRMLLFVSQTLLGAISVVTALLLLMGNLTLLLMYVLVLVSGVIRAFDTPVRQVIVTDIVPLRHASNAIGLNSASVNGARLIGPAAAGLLLALIGSGWVFLINSSTFAVMIVALALLRARDLVPRARLSGRQGVGDGFRYVVKRSDLAVVFAVTLLIGAFGVNLPIFVSTAALEFGSGPEGFGLLTSALAIGALAGSLFAASRDRASIRIVVLGAGGFGAAFAAAALAPSAAVYAAVVVGVGFAMSTVTSASNAYTQTTTDPALRGRVLALYLAIIIGGGPPAALLLGWLTSAFGARAGSWAGAVAGMLAFVIGGISNIAAGPRRKAQGEKPEASVDPAGSIPSPRLDMAPEGLAGIITQFTDPGSETDDEDDGDEEAERRR